MLQDHLAIYPLIPWNKSIVFVYVHLVGFDGGMGKNWLPAPIINTLLFTACSQPFTTTTNCTRQALHDASCANANKTANAPITRTKSSNYSATDNWTTTGIYNAADTRTTSGNYRANGTRTTSFNYRYTDTRTTSGNCKATDTRATSGNCRAITSQSRNRTAAGTWTTRGNAKHADAIS